MLGGLTAEDVLHVAPALPHTNALNTCMQALIHGSRVVVGPRFSASRFWQRLVEADATVTYLLGAMISILSKTPPSPYETQHRVRWRSRRRPRPSCTTSSVSASASSCATASG
jgi:crotonobetaine/carnitine-CoA ligase